MQPPELYIMASPGLSPEELKKHSADADKSADAIQNLKGFHHLPEEIRAARRVKKSIARHLRKRDHRH